MKKSILFIISHLHGGGAEKVLIDVLRNFDYSKFNVDLCLIYPQGVYLSDVPSKVNVISLYKSNRDLFSRIENRIYWHLRIGFFQSFRINRKVSKTYDTIISFLEGEPVKYHRYVSRLAKRNISWVHTDLYNNYNTVGAFLTPDDELKSYRAMDEIVFVSNEAMIQFGNRFRLDVKKKVLYNPIDRQLILKTAKEEDVPKGKFLICSVGRLCDVKAFDRLVRVAKRLTEDGYDFEYQIIGVGELLLDLQSLRDKLGLSDRFQFPGYKNPVTPWLGRADLFVSTSKAEGFPLVVCEALCLGIPVVATRCAGTEELLGNNEFGVLTNHDDESIYNGILDMVKNNQNLEHYRQKSVERSGMFDIQKTMNEIYQIITN